MYQYTVIDDCTRYRVLRLYKRRTAANTVDFIERLLDEMPFPIQRIQTDRGTEFFAYKVQETLYELGIKFRPNKPASPHLNGKVERSQKTDKIEFYATVDVNDPDLQELLGYWQHYYNWERPHSALGGMTPMDKYFELMWKTPYWADVWANYDPDKEPFRVRDYSLDMKINKLK